MKKIYLLLILFLTSGCSVNYNLTIDSNTILENINISIPTNETDSETFENQISHDRPVYFDNGITYNMTTKENDNNYYVNYKYKHDIKDFTKSSFLNVCYNSNDININDDEISISTNDIFNCVVMDDGFHADSVDINITTKLKVLENNADEVNGNKYTWHINDKNYLEKPIYIKMKKKPTINAFINNQKDSSMFKFSLVIFSLVVVAFALYLHFRRKYTKKNSL